MGSLQRRQFISPNMLFLINPQQQHHQPRATGAEQSGRAVPIYLQYWRTSQALLRRLPAFLASYFASPTADDVQQKDKLEMTST